MKIRDLPNTEFKITVIKMLSEVRGAMYEQSEKNTKKYQTEIIELKDTLEQN